MVRFLLCKTRNSKYIIVVWLMNCRNRTHGSIVVKNWIVFHYIHILMLAMCFVDRIFSFVLPPANVSLHVGEERIYYYFTILYNYGQQIVFFFSWRMHANCQSCDRCWRSAAVIFWMFCGQQSTVNIVTGHTLHNA